jgi:hypothetical protein
MHTRLTRRHSRRPAPKLLVLLGVMLGAIALAAPAQADAAKPAVKGQSDCMTSATGALSPMDGICDYLDGRGGVVQVALFDEQAGRMYRLSNGDNTQYTASIAKVDILARWLRKYQKQGAEIPGDIPYSIKYLMGRMIQNSDNAAATALFHFGGGCDPLMRFNMRIPMDDTEVGCESSTYYGWGNTTTTAADQVRLMRVFSSGKPKGVLGPDARSYGRQLMQGVEPDQRFGISCGPWGTSCDPPNYAQPDPDVTVGLKNGWKTLPTCTQPIDQCPWQVNSTGWVRGNGRNYVLTVLTTRDPVGSGGLYGFNYGIDTIQNVSERIWDNLG